MSVCDQLALAFVGNESNFSARVTGGQLWYDS